MRENDTPYGNGDYWEQYSLINLNDVATSGTSMDWPKIFEKMNIHCSTCNN
jgi:hypothetical protein